MTGEPRLCPIEVLVRKQHVFAEPIHQRTSAVVADEVAGQGPQQFRQSGQDNDDDQVEVVRFIRNLAAGQHPAIDDGQLCAYR